MDPNPYEPPGECAHISPGRGGKPGRRAKFVLWLVAAALIACDLIGCIAIAFLGGSFAHAVVPSLFLTCGVTGAVYLTIGAVGQGWPGDRPTGLWALVVLVSMVAALSLLVRLAEYGQAVQFYQAAMAGRKYMNCAPPPRFLIWAIDIVFNGAAFLVASLIALLRK